MFLNQNCLWIFCGELRRVHKDTTSSVDLICVILSVGEKVKIYYWCGRKDMFFNHHIRIIQVEVTDCILVNDWDTGVTHSPSKAIVTNFERYACLILEIVDRRVISQCCGQLGRPDLIKAILDLHETFINRRNLQFNACIVRINCFRYSDIVVRRRLHRKCIGYCTAVGQNIWLRGQF